MLLQQVDNSTGSFMWIWINGTFPSFHTSSAGIYHKTDLDNTSILILTIITYTMKYAIWKSEFKTDLSIHIYIFSF